jgi:hypothetical protein
MWHHSSSTSSRTDCQNRHTSIELDRAIIGPLVNDRPDPLGGLGAVLFGVGGIRDVGGDGVGHQFAERIKIGEFWPCQTGVSDLDRPWKFCTGPNSAEAPERRDRKKSKDLVFFTLDFLFFVIKQIVKNIT